MGELLARTSSRELAEWQAYFAMGADSAVLEDLKARALQRLGESGKRRRRR